MLWVLGEIGIIVRDIAKDFRKEVTFDSVIKYGLHLCAL